MKRDKQIDRTKGAILLAAQKKQLITYKESEAIMGARSGSSIMSAVLTDIMDDDYNSGKPFTCATIVSSVTGMPGPGFFTVASNILAHNNKSVDLTTTAAKTAFWMGELQKTYKTVGAK